MKNSLLTISLFLFGLASPALGSSASLTYEVRGFGSSNLVVIISGEGYSTLSVAPNTDGTSVRVSGVGTVFSRKGAEPALPLLSGINQVKRGNSTDLIINLTASSQISATPSASALQISISKLRGSDIVLSTPTPTLKPVSAQEQLDIAKLENTSLKEEIVKLKAELLRKESELLALKGR